MTEKRWGLYGKYQIAKADGSPIDPEACYFILRYDRDPHARIALRAYAESVRAENPALAADLRSALGDTAIATGTPSAGPGGELAPERLAEIRGRLAAATPGPWEVDEDDGCIYQMDGEIRAPVPLARVYGDEADADLILHLPSDMADLLAEVERFASGACRGPAGRRGSAGGGEGGVG